MLFCMIHRTRQLAGDHEQHYMTQLTLAPRNLAEYSLRNAIAKYSKVVVLQSVASKNETHSISKSWIIVYCITSLIPIDGFGLNFKVRLSSTIQYDNSHLPAHHVCIYVEVCESVCLYYCEAENVKHTRKEKVKCDPRKSISIYLSYYHENQENVIDHIYQIQ